MELNDRDIDWQKEAPTLAAIGDKTPFTVPQGYFENLSNTINSRIFVESVHADQSAGFDVPEGYFEDLSSSIISKISVDRIKAVAPSEGFTVPEGYFADLAGRIEKRRELSERPAPVRKLITSWIGYAAAACITVMIATGIYFNSSTYTFNKQLSEIPEEEIINYLQAHSTPGDTPFIMENLNPDQLESGALDVSAEELELYINSTTL